ncbi:hypothetical protein [Saccharopolyspora sp. ASAGF58]|uniref:hypothetical protein n=1 Tax=Saccharopolyspora sp. ASAGF58 TaxID=2719023 RepID=UPI00143FD2D3|nr:hypothetical protein [Saccharopolyspora sp. ASAGF58]QIZ34865.1 hypothetical protein FDZ84_09175 [Saccharopolyspora sp. ASAGF58]
MDVGAGMCLGRAGAVEAAKRRDGRVAAAISRENVTSQAWRAAISRENVTSQAWRAAISRENAATAAVGPPFHWHAERVLKQSHVSLVGMPVPG